MRGPSISVHFVRAVLHHAPRLGINPGELMRSNRLSPRLLEASAARVSVERFADLQANTILAMADESLGYTRRRLPAGSWAMMCHAVIGSETLGQALSRYCRFYQLFELDLSPRLDVSDSTASIVFAYEGEADPAFQPFLAELLMVNAYRFACWLVQEQLPLQAVQFSCPITAQPADYRNMFAGNPVAFQQPACALSFAPGLLDRQLTQSERSLRHFLRHPVLHLLSQNYVRHSWTARVRQLVAKDMHNMPELLEVAATLELHPQTLRRRLSVEGTTFKDIKNQLRQDTALHYLGKQGLSIEDIAHRSGFSESSAFIRAFKGWTGTTPYSYRKGL